MALQGNEREKREVNVVEWFIIQLYVFLSSFKVVGALGGYLVAYWLLPWIRDLVPLPSVIVVIMSMGVGYVIGARLDHQLRVPWQPLLSSPLWAHDAPTLAILSSSDDVAMLQQRNGEKTCGYLSVHSIPQEWHVNVRRLQKQPHGLTIREGKHIGSWFILTPPASSSSSVIASGMDSEADAMIRLLEEGKHAVLHAVPYLRCDDGSRVAVRMLDVFQCKMRSLEE